jgi:hypothetical protein
MRADDGIVLAGRLWSPDQGEGPWPVLLMRQPSGRAIASTVTYAHPSWYADRGFLVLVQDVRGCGDSEGDFAGFGQEAADGAAAVRWSRRLPQANGRVGTYGFSYQGLSQLLNASAADPGRSGLDDPLPDCLAPAMAGLDERLHWASEGGAHWWSLGLAWALQLAAAACRRRGDGDGWWELRRSLESGRFLEEGPSLLARHDPGGMGWRWLGLDPECPRNWRIHPVAPVLLQRPLLLIGGWHDPHLRGVLDLWRRSRQAGGSPELLIGAWTHLQWRGGCDERQLAFFRRHLSAAAAPDKPTAALESGTRDVAAPAAGSRDNAGSRDAAANTDVNTSVNAGVNTDVNTAVNPAGPWQIPASAAPVPATLQRELADEAPAPARAAAGVGLDRSAPVTADSDAAHPVVLQDIATGLWQAFTPEVPAPSLGWRLHSQGLAAVRSLEGLLLACPLPDGPPAPLADGSPAPLVTGPAVPPAPGPPAPQGDGLVVLVHDPWRPVPGRGGHLGLDAGVVERGDLDGRADVACFSGEPLASPLTLIGCPWLQLDVEADQPGFDLCGALSVLSAEGSRVRQVSPGVLRQRGDHCRQRRRRHLALQPLAIRLQPGERLRLSLAAAAWPQIAVNAGDGQWPLTAPGPGHRVITLQLHLAGAWLGLAPLLEHEAGAH